MHQVLPVNSENDAVGPKLASTVIMSSGTVFFPLFARLASVGADQLGVKTGF